MNHKDKDSKYRKNFLFRLTKVCYIIALILAILLVILAGWDERPQLMVDSDKSNIICSDGRKYKFTDSGIYLSSKDSKLSSYQEDKASTLCSNSGWSTYYLDIVENTYGSWFRSVLWWSLGIIGSYIFLNLIRETLNYLFLGKSFDWEWVMEIREFLKETEEEKQSYEERKLSVRASDKTGFVILAIIGFIILLLFLFILIWGKQLGIR